MSDARQTYLDGMSRAAAAVSIVTTDGPAGRAGVTVTAMTSVSADAPRPVLLVCVHRQSAVAAVVDENRAFCVNVLRYDQERISEIFAGRLPPPASGDRFDCDQWIEGATGAPQLANPLVAFDCRLESERSVGLHRVLFGAVEAVRVPATGTPLIYVNRGYGVSS